MVSMADLERLSRKNAILSISKQSHWAVAGGGLTRRHFALYYHRSTCVLAMELL